MGPRVYKGGDIYLHKERDAYIMLLTRRPYGRWNALDLRRGDTFDLSEGAIAYFYRRAA